MVSISCGPNTCYSYRCWELIELTFLSFIQEERPTGILEKLLPDYMEKWIWIAQGVNWDGHGDNVPPGSALRKDLLPQLGFCSHWWLSGVTPSRDGHSCREMAPPRPCPSWGTPHLTANPGRGMNIQHGATLMVHFGSEIPTRSPKAVVRPALQLDFPFCTILLPSSPVHRYWSQDGHCLNILHAKFCPRICFPENPACLCMNALNDKLALGLMTFLISSRGKYKWYFEISVMHELWYENIY